MAATPSTSQPVAPTRSHLIHRAAEHYPSRFALVRAAARCARLFHNPGQRIGESINQALERIADPGVGALTEMLRLQVAIAANRLEDEALINGDGSEPPLGVIKVQL